jgi:hypothetical protein
MHKKFYLEIQTAGIKVLVDTSNRASRLFWLGGAEGDIQKLRSVIFEITKSSGVPVTQPHRLWR